MRKEKEGRGSAFEVYGHATFGHALGIVHDFEVFGVVGVARQGFYVVDCHGEYAVIRGGRAENVDAVFERMEFGLRGFLSSKRNVRGLFFLRRRLCSAT